MKSVSNVSANRHHAAALLVLTLVCTGGAVAAEPPVPEGPDFKAVLDLPSVGDPRISPDGDAVAYVVRRADWDENRYDAEIWLARVGEEPFQLTRTGENSSSDPRWSPNGRWIAFLADRGDETQIHLIAAGGGEARPLTAVTDGVGAFEWSPDGRWLAVKLTEPRDERREKIEESYGEFAVEDAEERMSHLWLLDVETALATDDGAQLPAEKEADAEEGRDADGREDAGEGSEDVGPVAFRRLTGGDDYTVGDFRFSPGGDQIAFDHTPDPRIESFARSDLSIVEVASGKVRALVERPGYDAGPRWSPDGDWLLFETKNGKMAYYFNSELAKVPAAGGEPTLLTADFDENPDAVGWLGDGILFLALDGTRRRLYRLSADGGPPEPIANGPERIWSVDVSRDGQTLAIGGDGPDSLEEIWRLDSGEAGGAERLTRMTEATADWAVGSRELIQWSSRDGAAIEGVLLKPEGFDPERKVPLLVIIHGGPAWLSVPERVYGYVYPVQQWLAKGAVILMPNYRGSAGYGEAFRGLNVRNLGVGDAWDVLSGVDHLIQRGYVDAARIGAMGWSQGGYISAFLTTSSDRFRAISVGAGISNWMTYYVNTDIHPFTRHYLEATPWDDPEIYAKTSPMTYIKQARTPTLIQHGELDRRVPTPNAYELFQGLQDVGVDARLIIYKGLGHGISKPKERLAAVWHNWLWFARHIWGEEVEMELE